MAEEKKHKDELVQRNSFFYELQYMRGLNPVYVFLTKGGVVTSILFYLIYDKYGGSLKLTFLSLFVYWVIYKKYYDYKYYELERVWLISIFIDFITKRRHRSAK